MTLYLGKSVLYHGIHQVSARQTAIVMTTTSPAAVASSQSSWSSLVKATTSSSISSSRGIRMKQSLCRTPVAAQLKLIGRRRQDVSSLSSSLLLSPSSFLPHRNLYSTTTTMRHLVQYSSPIKTAVGGTTTKPRISPRIINLSNERVFTTITQRYSPPLHRSSTSTIMMPRCSGHSQYSIPTKTLLLGSKSMIRSPIQLSMAQSFSDGGPSRFPQVNRSGGNPSSSNRWVQGMGLVGAATVVLGKTKYILAAMKVTKLASLGSMALSIGAYSMLFGWPYAIGMVGLIFFHECGHLAVMVQRGIPFSPMVFIPFIGAAVTMKDHPRDAWEDAVIAAGGPIAGTMASCAVAVAANVTDSQVLYALADFGYMINLINLLPIGSMDGGRWAGALSKYVGVAGLGIGGYVAWSGMFPNPLFYLILLAGGYETFMRFYDPYHLPPNFFRISNTQRAILTGSYFGLIAFLLTAMAANQRRQKPPEVIAREQGSEPFWDARF